MESNRIAAKIGVVFLGLLPLAATCLGQAAAPSTGTIDGQAYAAAWKTLKSPVLEVVVDSVGALQVKFTAAPGEGSFGPPMTVALDGQRGPFWQQCRVETLPGDSGLVIEGVTAAGMAVKQTVTLADTGLKVDYETDRALGLAGNFPASWSANWFWAKSPQGEIQGELWGTYEPMVVSEILEYTYLFRRIRVGLPGSGQMKLTSPNDLYAGAGFTVATTSQSPKHVVGLEIHNLPPDQAPLHGDTAPVVTKPFDPRKLVTGTPAMYLNVGFAKPQAFEPSRATLAPAKGYPSVFRAKEPLAFKVAVTSTGSEPPVVAGQRSLSFKCYQSLDDTLQEEGAIDFPENLSEQDLTFRPKEAGPYRVEFFYGDQKIGEDEFVVAGPVAQRLVAPSDPNQLKLRLVDSVDCGDENDQHEFYSYSQQAKRVTDPRVGKFMESSPVTDIGYRHDGAVGFEWFGYRIGGLAKDKPHLLEVSYPDLDDMVMAVQIGQCRNLENPRSDKTYGLFGSGVVTGLAYPVTGQVKKFTVPFYPHHEWGLIEFTNYCKDGKPIRVSGFKIYEIEDDLPAMAGPEGGDQRLVGAFNECSRQAIFSFATAGILEHEIGGEYGNIHYEQYYKYFYLAAARLVKQLRYRGENTWFVGAHRYNGATFPSLTARNSETSQWKDQLAVFARMFEENGLALVLTVPITNDKYQFQMLDRYTRHDIAAGSPTILQLDGQGQPLSLFGNRVVNPLHPQVREVMNAMVGELAERYQDYPAVKAIALLAGHDGWIQPAYATNSRWLVPAGGSPEDSYFLAGYDDLTWSLFRKGRKDHLPDFTGPGRFTERKKYLLENLKDAWIAFRCEQLAQVKAELARTVREQSPRLAFFDCDYWHTQEWVFAQDPAPLLDQLKQIGSDIVQATANPDLVYGYYFNATDGVLESHMAWLPRKLRERFRTMNLDPSTSPLIEENGNLGAWLGRQFVEGEAGADPQRPWYYASLRPCKYILPGDRNLLEDFALIMARCTPKFFCHNWGDDYIQTGHDADFREFCLAYRAIPAGPFKTLHRTAVPGVCLRGFEKPDGGTVFYVVNTANDDRGVIVESTGTLRELSPAGPAPIQDGAGYEIALRKFELRVFELAGGKLGGIFEVRSPRRPTSP